MHTLTLHELNSITKCGISKIFLHNDQVHYFFNTWILKHSLCLACNSIRKSKVSHYSAGIIWWTDEISCFDFTLRLVWASIAIINATCKFEHCSHFRVESPLTSKLKLLTKRKHHIDVKSVHTFVLFEHSGVLQKLVESFWFPINNQIDKAKYKFTYILFCLDVINSIISS